MSNTLTKDTTVRAAAILTTSDVASTAVNLFNTDRDEFVAFQIDFTLGSLTNGIFNPQLSWDNTNWYDVYSGGTAAAITLTADGKISHVVNCHGAKYVRITVKGTGTVTGSSATVTAHYLNPNRGG